MLLLTFRTGESLYAVDARQVVEVVPRVGVRPVPHAPDYLLGLLCYRGRVFPVVDFARLAGAPPSRDALSTRLIVAEFPSSGGGVRRIGILAESVNQVIEARAGQVVLPGMDLDEAPYLGRMIQLEEGQGLVQVVKPERMLPDRLQESLYGDQAESAR
jgi:chemotaxis-related protein WspB